MVADWKQGCASPPGVSWKETSRKRGEKTEMWGEKGRGGQIDG